MAFSAAALVFPPPPAGYRVHVEGQAGILVPEESSTHVPDKDKQQHVFVNPIQEFNRDVSIAVIRGWSDLFDGEKKQVWQKKQDKRRDQHSNGSGRKRKIDQVNGTAAGPLDAVKSDTHGALDSNVSTETSSTSAVTIKDFAVSTQSYTPYKFTCFEGLSATGLRSIRYAKEIPLLRWVQANDLLAAAADNISLNVEFNGLGCSAHSSPPASTSDTPATNDIVAKTPANTSADDPPSSQTASRKGKNKPVDASATVRVSQGDCTAELYAHRAEKDRFDVVDLDPYGTAAPFIDGAVQAVSDGGLLCVTCTDLAVLAGTNYPEKCYSNYGGLPARAEFTHEVALRLVLHTVATSAARYGRYIEPLLSLSVDYYLRVFVRVATRPEQVKRLASQIMLTYVCTGCRTWYNQDLGKATEKINQSTGKSTTHFGVASGPPIGMQCQHCGFNLQIAGPMWAGRLHDNDLVDRVLQHIKEDESRYGTASRITGMLSLARQELETPFYFNPAKVASLFHATCPPLHMFASACLNAGYQVSRSHTQPGTLKTDAPQAFVLDVVREFIKSNPIKMSNVKPGSPAAHLLAREQSHEVDITPHKDVESKLLMNVKLVRYQTNPTANWGPQSRAKNKLSKVEQTRNASGSDVTASQNGSGPQDTVMH